MFTIRLFPAVILAAAVSLSGQVPAETLEVTLRLTTPGFSSTALTTVRPSSHRLAVRSRRFTAEPPPVERSAELSEERIVVAGCDGEGREVVRMTLPDPRLLRAEAPDEAGRLSTRLLYRAEAEFTVALPADAETAVLRIFHPVWDGRSFGLVLLAEVRLEDDGRMAFFSMKKERVAGEIAFHPERSGTLVRVTERGWKATSRDRTRSLCFQTIDCHTVGEAGR